jgi:hypothetical protein
MRMFAGLDLGFKRTAVCVLDRGQEHVRRLVQIMARHRVSMPRDAKHYVRIAGLVAPGREPQIGCPR